MLAIFAGALSARAADAPPIRVGSKSFTEGVILGEIATLALGGQGLAAEHKAALGGSQVLWRALLRGDLDVYADYTGTLLHETLANQHLRDVASLAAALRAVGIGMTPQLGFNNTYALGMPRRLAARLGVTTISDLRRQPALRFALSSEFAARPDGWPAVRERYALAPASVSALEHEMAYRAIGAGAADVTDVYSTDAEIKAHDLVTLQDDLAIFPAYFAVYLYRLGRAATIPQLLPTLQRLAGRLPDQAMRDLNAQVKFGQKTERAVAQSFLQAQGLLTAPSEGATTRPGWWLSPADWQRLGQDTRRHLLLVFLPLAAAILIGIPLGILAAHYARLGNLLLHATGIIQTIPSLALLVFMIPVLGIGYPPALAALCLYGLLPIVRNTYLGIHDLAPELRESAAALGLSPWRQLLTVELPLASRAILAGIKIAAVINVGTATLGAMIGAGGYGESIMMGIRRDDARLLLQGAVPAALMAVLLQALFSLVERRLVPAGLRLRSPS